MHAMHLGSRVYSLATVVIAGLAFQAGYALGTYRFFGERKKHRKVLLSSSARMKANLAKSPEQTLAQAACELSQGLVLG